MKKMIATLVTTLIAGTGSAWAQDEAMPTTTVGEATEVTKGVFDKTWSITPRVGSFGFQDSAGNYTSRITEGITFNGSFMREKMAPGMDLGFETGLLYSHVGSPGSNWFGADADVQTAEGNNAFLIPINATVGYKFAENWLGSLALGATMVNRSIGNAYQFGREGDLEADGATDFFPDLGLNIGWAVGKNVALSARGEIIPTPADDIYTATLGAQIGLG